MYKKYFNKLRSIEDEKLEILTIYTLYISIIITYFLSWKNGLPNYDAGYYLSITNYIHNGLNLFSNIHIDYTALTFYIILPLKYILGEYFDYKTAILFIYLLQIVNAYLIYKIGLTLNFKNKISHIGALTYLLLSITNEGEYYVLEPCVYLFGLSAIYYILKNSNNVKHNLYTGVFAALSFFSKQYGFGYSVLIIL
jgi:hypothetical protein